MRVLASCADEQLALSSKSALMSCSESPASRRSDTSESFCSSVGSNMRWPQSVRATGVMSPASS